VLAEANYTIHAVVGVFFHQLHALKTPLSYPKFTKNQWLVKIQTPTFRFVCSNQETHAAVKTTS
jgi:hypothetical protein